MARERRHARQLPPGGRRLPRRAEPGGRGACCRPASWPSAAPAPPTRSGCPTTPDQHRQEQLQPARRLRLAAGRRTTRRCCAAASASSTRRWPCRACATCWPPTSSATRRPTRAAGSRHGFSRRRRRSSTRPTSATRASTRTSRAPDIYQYNLTLERELPGDLGLRVSYIGSTMRKLARGPRLQHAAREHRRPSTPTNPDDYARLPFPLYGYYMDNVDNRGEGQLHAGQLELRRRWKGGFALNVAYTLRPLGQQRARHRQQQPGRRCCSTPTTSRRTAARTRTW